MRFVDYMLISERDTGKTDALGNVIAEKVESGPYQGRFTEWTADDVAVNGRDLTSGSRKMVTRGISHEYIQNAIAVKIDGSEYEIGSVKDLGSRWQLLTIKGFRL